MNWNLARKRRALQIRAEIVSAVRFFFQNEGYLEIDTPLLIPSPAPESHIDALPALNGYLQTSPELCMKRLLAAGYERIYQISHCWRAEERGVKHLPEFTMLEWYRVDADYLDLMTECEALLKYIAKKVLNDTLSIKFRNQLIALSDNWDRLTVRDAFRRFTNSTAEAAVKDGSFDELMAFSIEPNLGNDTPCFLYDYPAERGALAKLKTNDNTVAERFELYICGVELANAFSELTDPLIQRCRFEDENRFRQISGKPMYPLPEKFLEELKFMPRSAGSALGVDRLVMLFTDAASIDDVVAFTPEEL